MPQLEAVQDAAEAFLVLLLAHGARQVFINPGTDTFPLQEAWARRRERGLASPEPVMCLHEHTAVSAAHGFFLGSGQPQAVLVHVDAGTLTNRPWVHTHLAPEEGETLFTPGGSSLGWAPNAAIGVKLARPERLVVALVGDGGFVFSNPLSALWSAQRAGAPFLTVIFNNGGYKASVAPIPALYPGGAVERLHDGLVTAIQPAPDYARVAEASGAFGVCVREPGELQPALRRALDEVEHRRCAVVDAVLQRIGRAR